MNKIITEESVKSLFGVDLLKNNTDDMSAIRVAIIEDRNYDIPEWFNDYITDQDIIHCINNILTSDKYISDKMKEFLSYHDKKGTIKSYNEIIQIMIENHRFSLAGYFNAKKMYYQFRKKVNLLNKFDIVKIIESICKVTGELLVIYIYLYLSVVESKHWYFKSREKLREALVNLIKYVNYKNRDIVYKTIYNSFIVNMEKSEIPYREFISGYGGVWFDTSKGVELVPVYLKYYTDHIENNKNHDKMMDTAVIPYLEEYRYICDNNKGGRTDKPARLHKKLLETIVRNPNNIKFLFDNYNYNPELSNIVKYKTSSFKNILGLDKYISMCDKSIHMDLIMRFISHNSGNIMDILPYINKVADNQKIYEFINNIAVNDLAELLEKNPTIYENTNVTLIDVIMYSLYQFTSDMIDKIRVAFSSKESVYKSLTSSERNILYFASNDIISVCTKYPDIIKYTDGISFADVSVMYKVNPDIIRYVNPTLITKGILMSHIRAHGYTELNNISDIGVENLLNIDNLIALIKVGKGYGYILDFSKIEYRNAVLQAIDVY